MEPYKNRPGQFTCISLEWFAYILPCLIIISSFHFSKAFGIKRCINTTDHSGSWLTRCNYYEEIPRDIPNASEVRRFDMGGSSQGNKIHTLKKGSLVSANLVKIVTLWLDKCEIHNIERGAFATATSSLMFLYLSYNKIEVLDPDVFDGLTKLSELSLRSNPIKRFEADTVFPPSLSTLKTLNMAFGNLDYLPDNVFDNLKLEALYLDNNELKTLTWRAFSNVKDLKFLSLYGNPWHCDCNIKFLIDTLLELKIKIKILSTHEPKCATSPNQNALTGKDWVDAEETHLACVPHIEKLQLFSYKSKGANSVIQDQSWVKLGQDVSIKCSFSGYPKPQVQWRKYVGETERIIKKGTRASSLSTSQSGQINHSVIKRDTDYFIDRDNWRHEYLYEDVYVIHDAQKIDSGRYSCQVTNFAGSAKTDVVLKLYEARVIEEPTEEESRNVDWKIFSWIGSALIAVSIILLRIWQKFRKEKPLPIDTTRIESQSRAPLSTPNRYEVALPLLPVNASRNSIFRSEGENSLGKLANFHELDLLSDLFIDIDNILGKGNFGTVYKGRAKGRDVAIKRLNENSPSATIHNLLSELKVFCFIGEHKNVVGFIGASTKEVSRGILYIVTELCSNGSLLDFLRLKRGVIDQPTNSYVNLHSSKFVSFEDLARISCEIASGMEYIAGKKVVHADLSARNVLLDSGNVCKIGDFGFARKLYECQEYIKTSQDPLPWKWMAYESLTKMEFTTKSDVWSYGIALWEIFSLGNVPFAGLHWTANFSEELLNGLRLPRPKHATEKVYDKMMECWEIDADERPSFSDLLKFFRNDGKTQDDSCN